MRLGLGLYRQMLTTDNFRFAKQAGATHIVAHLDEGAVDMFRVLHILHSNGFEGVLIPDHTPQMSCDAPWYAGMAYALGYLKAAITSIEAG